MKIHKGDKVKVITGKDRGKEALVERVIPEKDLIVVENVNVVTRHIKSTPQREGGMVKLNKPIHVSNVMLICPKTSKPTRVVYKEIDGKKHRISQKSGEIIKPAENKK